MYVKIIQYMDDEARMSVKSVPEHFISFFLVYSSLIFFFKYQCLI